TVLSLMVKFPLTVLLAPATLLSVPAARSSTLVMSNLTDGYFVTSKKSSFFRCASRSAEVLPSLIAGSTALGSVVSVLMSDTSEPAVSAPFSTVKVPVALVVPKRGFKPPLWYAGQFTVLASVFTVKLSPAAVATVCSADVAAVSVLDSLHAASVSAAESAKIDNFFIVLLVGLMCSKDTVSTGGLT